MCFSATASFGASALLAGAGVVAMKKAETPKMLPFASMPLFFSAHQLCEGLVWLSLTHPEWAAWQQPCTYFYLFIAQLTWPLWVPFAIWLMEPDRERKKILSYFLWIGGAFAVFLAYCFFAYEVSATIESRHIRYQMDFPNLSLRRIFYVLVTLGPLFLSSLKWMKLLAWSFSGSLVLTYFFYTNCILSVWCFFAALLSALVLLVITTYNKQAGSRLSPA